MFLAIINDTYSEVKEELSSQKDELQLSDILKQVMNTEHCATSFILNSWRLRDQIKGELGGEEQRVDFVMEILAIILGLLWRHDPSLKMWLMQQRCIFPSGKLNISLYYLVSAHPYCIAHSALFFIILLAWCHVCLHLW